jgi:hypothetical protein
MLGELQQLDTHFDRFGLVGASAESLGFARTLAAYRLELVGRPCRATLSSIARNSSGVAR